MIRVEINAISQEDTKMILVTGGAGYIGSHTVLELMRAGQDVIVYDNLQKGHRAATERIGARLVVGDLRDQAALSAVFKTNDIGHVIHFAAESLVGESMQNPLKYYDNNVYGTCCLVREMVAAGVKNLVFSSTAAVYGEPKAVPLDEGADKTPTNVYGETKLAIEKMLGWASSAHGLNYVALRYFNAAGADETIGIGEDHQPETHLIPLVLRTALGKMPEIQVFGDDYPTRDGTCVRDYIHVTDLANAHIMALAKLDGNECATYNLGNGTGFTVREVLDAARAVTGREIPTVVAGRRAGDPAVLIASPQKIKDELQWEPRYTTIQAIIASAWQWHLNNPEGYAD